MISKIVDRIFVGDWNDALLLNITNPNSVNCVLNVCETKDTFLDVTVNYLHQPFADGHSIPRSDFDTCMDWLKIMYEKNERILIHCHLGISRSPTICSAFLVRANLAENIDSAYKIVKTSRTQADPAPLVFASAKNYLEE